MARKVFYSFHYERDSQRAAQVRNSHAIADEDEYGVIDSVEWEKVERQGKDAIQKWIDDQLKYTSVTAVLVGAETAGREWVNYEIRKSWERGNGLVGVRIHNVKNLDSKTDVAGPNPFDGIFLENDSPLSSVCRTYDWVTDGGIANLGKWAEEAFQARASYKGERNLKDETRITPNLQSRVLSGPTVITNPPKPWSM